jgi:hypothetical protein
VVHHPIRTSLNLALMIDRCLLEHDCQRLEVLDQAQEERLLLVALQMMYSICREWEPIDR